MEINITDNLYIRSDERNLILSKKRITQEGEHVGKVYWQDLGYYRTFAGFCKGAFDSLVRASEAKSIIELEKDVTAAATALQTVYKELDNRLQELEMKDGDLING